MALKKIISLVSVAAVGTFVVYGMGCSSSTTSGTGGGGGNDSGTKTDTGTIGVDSSVKDTGGSSGDDASGNQGDDSGGDGGMTCPDNTPFMAITWAPPTKFNQGLCSTAQIAAYNTSLMGMGPFTSGAASCDACIQTDQAAAAHGPIVSVMSVPQELNIGGCLANESGVAADAAKGGCGNQLNNANDCIEDECGDCSDAENPTKGGPFATCDQTVLGTGGVCASDGLSTACNTELNEDGGIQICLNDTLVQLLTLWCGSATPAGDSGSVEASTTDGPSGG